MALSVAWHPTNPHVIGTTLSDGMVVLCEATQGALWTSDCEVKVTTVYQHSLEAWWLAFTPFPNNDELSIYSGGDDMLLQRSSSAGNTALAFDPVWQDRRIHEAGVTYILPLSWDLILTGSYDDNIRLISAPATGRRQVLAEANLGGGVWRLKVVSQTAGAEKTSRGVSSVLSDTVASSSSTRYVQGLLSPTQNFK